MNNFGTRWNCDDDAVPASLMMKTPMGITAKILSASDDDTLLGVHDSADDLSGMSNSLD